MRVKEIREREREREKEIREREIEERDKQTTDDVIDRMEILMDIWVLV